MNQESDEADETDVLELTDESISRVKPLQILPYQKEHFKRVLEMLAINCGILDNSAFGCGKGVCAVAVAIAFKMGILVFAPKSVLPSWVKNCKLYGVTLYASMTYNALRGTSKTGIKHGFLERTINEEQNAVSYTHLTLPTILLV